MPYDKTIIRGIYDYSGIQRSGKSCLLVRDVALIKSIDPDRKVYSNFTLRLPGVITMNSDNLINEILTIKKRKERHLLIAFDELSQVLTGRGYSKQIQTDVSTFLWQMPKRDIILFYTSNVGKSVDLIIRLATWYTILPKHISGINGDPDTILYWQVSNYRPPEITKHILIDPSPIYKYYDTEEEIE